MIRKITGVPPLTFVSNGENLVDYRIDGASGGVGDRTENLFDGEWFTCGGIAQMAPVGSEYRQVVQPTPTLQSRVATKNLIKTTGTLRVTCNKKYQIYLTYFDTRLKYTGNHSKDWQSSPVIAPFYGEYVSVAIKTENNRNLTEEELPEINLMVNTGKASLPYEPYGYKIPIVCGGTTTNIYLDEPLEESESISMSDTGLSIPTINGSNTLSVDTSVQPSSVYVKYATNERGGALVRTYLQGVDEMDNWAIYNYIHRNGSDSAGELVQELDGTADEAECGVCEPQEEED